MMSIPVSGIILAPISVAIFVFARSRLSEWAVFVSVFQAAAIANVDGGFSFGLGPYFFVATVLTAIVIPQCWSGRIRFSVSDPALAHLRLMGIFVAWSVFSAFTLPMLFAGTPVDDPRKGVDVSATLQMPLHWTFSNAGQATYMVLNFFMLLHMLQMSEHPGYIERLQSAFSWSGVFVLAVGAYQLACSRWGMEFPVWLFNSNLEWGQSYNQWFNGITRLSATFVEPSEAAAFLSSWALFEVSIVISSGASRTWHWACVIAGTIALAETASTAGYITVVIMWATICVNTVRTALTRGRIRGRAVLALGVMTLGAFVVFAQMPNTRLFLNAVLFQKSYSKSANHRVATLGRAVEVFYNTLALGAGLGSNRAMSLCFYILSDLGCPGLILLCCLLSQLWSQYRKRLRQHSHSSTTIFLRAAGVAYTANLLALVFSGAEVTAPRLWILWGMLAAGLRRAWLLEHAASEVIYLGPDSVISGSAADADCDGETSGNCGVIHLEPESIVSAEMSQFVRVEHSS